ncbi:LuxR C-terminal-related transcriptional regulator [Streptomyces sp. 4N509B]|uniref:LuxR C-terminal-related transcriptional regulator n=1 Tax=Streptomyces sp. 4N509B TaxID=3457413 RepID=UPI003FCF0A87
MIRILLVHDACLLRSALASLVGGAEDIDVTTASWEEAEKHARRRQADVWIADTDGCGAVPLPLAAQLVCQEASARAELLVLAERGRPGLLREAYDARALGYVSKDAPPERLLTAIRRVAGGERFVDDALAYDFLQAAEMPLTRRELSVLSLAADGAPVAEIAERLRLARGTVRNYLAAITRKTGARNRVDAIRISRGAGWV